MNLLASALYCNIKTGRCGDTKEFEMAQESDMYDWNNKQCLDSVCQRLSETHNRCGARYGRCNRNLNQAAVYCNEEKGWCGDDFEHQNADPSENYDWINKNCPGTMDFNVGFWIFLLIVSTTKWGHRANNSQSRRNETK